MPRPPARVDSRKTKMSVSVLNSSISTILQKKTHEMFVRTCDGKAATGSS